MVNFLWRLWWKLFWRFSYKRHREIGRREGFHKGWKCGYDSYEGIQEFRKRLEKIRARKKEKNR